MSLGTLGPHDPVATAARSSRRNRRTGEPRKRFAAPESARIDAPPSVVSYNTRTNGYS